MKFNNYSYLLSLATIMSMVIFDAYAQSPGVPTPGDLEITLRISDEVIIDINSEGYIPDSVFDIQLDCTDDSFDQIIQLAQDQSALIEGIDESILCTLEQVAAPSTAPATVLSRPPQLVASNLNLIVNQFGMIQFSVLENTVGSVIITESINNQPACSLVLDDFQESLLTANLQTMSPNTSASATEAVSDNVLGDIRSVAITRVGEFTSSNQFEIISGNASGRFGAFVGSGSSANTVLTYNAGGAGLNADLSQFKLLAFEIIASTTAAGDLTATVELDDGSQVALLTLPIEPVATAPNAVTIVNFVFEDFTNIDNVDLTDIDEVRFSYGTDGSTFLSNSVTYTDLSFCAVDDLGDLIVTQQVIGDDTGLPPGSMFDISVDCNVNNFDSSFQLAAGSSMLIENIPIGTTCVVNQTAVPTPFSDFIIEPAVIVPQQTVIEGGVQSVVNVTNNITGSADLSVNISAAPEPVIAGQSLIYTVTVDNLGPVDAVNVVVNSSLVENLMLRGMSVATSGCTEDPNGAPDCNLGNLAVGNQAQYTISVPIDPASLGGIDNTATISSDTLDLEAGNNVAAISTEIVASADLSLTKVDDMDPIDAGQTLTYTITVTNNGPSLASGIVVTDTLPAGVSLVSTSGCAEDPMGVPTCSLPDLAPKAQAGYSIEVVVAEETLGTITNSASVTATTADPDKVNNTSSEDTLVNPIEADLVLSKQSVTEFAVPLQPLVFSLTVENLGPGLAENVMITDVLPEGLELMSTQGCAADPQGLPSCAVGDLAAAERVTVLVNTVVEEGSRAAITNTATVLSDTDDPNLGNNQDSATLTVFIPVPIIGTPGLLLLIFLTAAIGVRVYRKYQWY